jgi:hypothetical protein
MTIQRVEPQRDGRGALRIPVRLQSTICSSAVRKVAADLVDLSTGGCRIATGLYMADGAHLTVTIPTLEPVGARAGGAIIWVLALNSCDRCIRSSYKGWPG